MFVAARLMPLLIGVFFIVIQKYDTWFEKSARNSLNSFLSHFVEFYKNMLRTPTQSVTQYFPGRRLEDQPHDGENRSQPHLLRRLRGYVKNYRYTINSLILYIALDIHTAMQVPMF